MKKIVRHILEDVRNKHIGIDKGLELLSEVYKQAASGHVWVDSWQPAQSIWTWSDPATMTITG